MDQSAFLGHELSNIGLNAFGQVPTSGERFQKSVQPSWLPARGRDERAIEKCALAVAKLAAIRSIDQTARGHQHGMTRRRIPFAGWRQTRIDIRLAFGDDAKLERRPNRDVSAGADRG